MSEGQEMRVIDEEPAFWFLFEQRGVLLFDVNCHHSIVSYPFLMVLNENELTQYKADGRAYLSQLASEIQYSAPGVIGSNSAYTARDVKNDYFEAVRDAVRRWRADGHL